MSGSRNGWAPIVYTAPGEGEVVTAVSDVATFKVTSEESGGRLILVEVATEPGGGPPPLHTHPPHEAFYVIEGEYEVEGMGEDVPFTVRATPGSVVYVPPGAPHTFKNVGSVTGRLLIVYTDREMELFARELAAASASMPPAAADLAPLAPIFAKHNVAFLAP